MNVWITANLRLVTKEEAERQKAQKEENGLSLELYISNFAELNDY